jgi:SAM-dependent methyltransferase
MGWTEPTLYGDAIADLYDDFTAKSISGSYENELDFLTRRIKGGPALELGVGTGRAAIPLAATGGRVVGIEASEAMIERLRSKDTSGTVDVRQGDFAEVKVEGLYSLIYVTLNTFCQLITQGDQLRCMRNVQSHLMENGLFVLATWARFPHLENDQVVKVWHITPDAVHLEASTWDNSTQQLTTQHIILSNGKVRINPMVNRLASPAEFDVMAALAGMRLRERYGGWDESPFGPQSTDHVSVYELKT